MLMLKSSSDPKAHISSKLVAVFRGSNRQMRGLKTRKHRKSLPKVAIDCSRLLSQRFKKRG